MIYDMLENTMIRASVIVLLFLAWALPSAADPNQYRPIPSGPPAGVYVGTLELYGRGTSSGAIEIRLRSGKLVQFFTAADPTKIDGRQIACTVPPERSSSISLGSMVGVRRAG